MSTVTDGVTTFSIVISLFVKVPVLSEQMTDADPNASTEDSFFTTAFFLAILWTPRARTTDRIAGRPSGTAATARETPTRNTETKSEGDAIGSATRIAPTTTAAIAMTAIPRARPTRPTSLWRGVGSSSV